MPSPPDPLKLEFLPPRVIFVRQRFTPFGGGELILDRIMTALSARGVRVALLGRSWNGRNDIEFIRCDPPRLPRIWRERRFAYAACRRLAQETGALVQSHERMPCSDVFRAGDGTHAAYLENRMRGIGRLARAGLRLHPFHRSMLALEREMFANPRLKAILANSAMVADDLVRRFSFPREYIHLVPNGIDLARFRPEAREQYRAEIRKRFEVDAKRPVVLFVGSGFKRKGLETAIAAMARDLADAELWVVGNERQPSAYAALAERAGIASRFRLIGPVPDPLPYYAAADVLFLPTIYDPFPSTAIEALACGMPVVTSTSCGARDIVARLDPALVRDAFDVDGMAEALGRAIELAALPKTADAARALVSGYSIETMIEKTLAVYARLGFGARNG
jgi:UDP-glucose:(heptosyl)LPS alpha-1,3-glucosyltransferase